MSAPTAHLDAMPEYRPRQGRVETGDPPPDGYLQWHEWARVQHKAGLRQRCCPGCSRWYYPQEVHDCAK